MKKKNLGSFPIFEIAPTTDFVSTRLILILWYAKGFRAKKKNDSPPSPSRTDTHRLHTQLNQKLCFYMLKFWRGELDYAILPAF